MRLLAPVIAVALLLLARSSAHAAPPSPAKDYVAEANERAREQATVEGNAKATKDIPTEMYERAKKLYAEELWKDPAPGQKVTPIKLLKAVPPKFPLIYRIIPTEGEIWVAFVVDAKGKVTDVKPLTEFESKFVEAAVEAVKKWKFEPATRDGKAVAVLVTVPLQFRLEKR